MSAKADTPKFFGAFHIISILVIVGACVFLYTKRKLLTDKVLAYMTLIIGIIMVLFEIYKQLVITYNPADDTWVYEWYAFPFQFCSTPIYITLLAFLFYKLKKQVIYEALMGFLATYSMVAGLMVIFVGTKSVFCPYIGINLQTIIHHGLMFILALAILFSGQLPFTKRTFIGSFAVFAPLLVLAMILNAFNPALDLFYISPHSTFAFKIISGIFFGGRLPYLVYLIGYIVLFTGASALVLYIANKIANKKSA